MAGYKFLQHTADVRLLVYGKDIAELIQSAAGALADFALGGKKIINKETGILELIEIDSVDSTALVIDFLSDVLYYMNENSAIYPHVRILNVSDKYIKAEILGFEIDSFDEDIKAVTYHEADVKRNRNGDLETIIVLDL